MRTKAIKANRLRPIGFAFKNRRFSQRPSIRIDPKIEKYNLPDINTSNTNSSVPNKQSISISTSQPHMKITKTPQTQLKQFKNQLYKNHNLSKPISKLISNLK